MIQGEDVIMGVLYLQICCGEPVRIYNACMRAPLTHPGLIIFPKTIPDISPLTGKSVCIWDDLHIQCNWASSACLRWIQTVRSWKLSNTAKGHPSNLSEKDTVSCSLISLEGHPSCSSSYHIIRSFESFLTRLNDSFDPTMTC